MSAKTSPRTAAENAIAAGLAANWCIDAPFWDMTRNTFLIAASMGIFALVHAKTTLLTASILKSSNAASRSRMALRARDRFWQGFMQIFRGYQEVQQRFSRPILTIGNFDGLHLGHRQIIEAVVKKARAEKGTSIVYTFRPHPQMALLPGHTVPLINTYDEKIEQLRAMDVDVVIEEPFNAGFSSLSPEDFFHGVLIKKLSVEAMHIGYDFGFGKNRSGSLELLQRLSRENGIELHISKPVQIEGQTCSSSCIRELLRTGDVTSANQLLGREFSYRGLVVHGDGRGHKLGFATANIQVEPKLLLKNGVYATRAILEGRTYRSVTNIGCQPTFNKDGTRSPIVETHILDAFSRDIYGATLEIRLVQRLRDETKFDSIERLTAQIRNDIRETERLL